MLKYRKPKEEVLPVVYGEIECGSSKSKLTFHSNYGSGKDCSEDLDFARLRYLENNNSSVIFIKINRGTLSSFMGITVEQAEEIAEGLLSMAKYMRSVDNV